MSVLTNTRNSLLKKVAINHHDLIGRPVLDLQQAASFQNWLGNYSEKVNFNGILMVKNKTALMLTLDNLVNISPDSDVVFKKLVPEVQQSIRVACKHEINL